MKLSRIHHIAIICSDYKKSKLFYVDILGYKYYGKSIEKSVNRINWTLK